MVYIEKKSKKSKRKTTYTMSGSDARLFLYSLLPTETKTNDYILAGADKVYELNDLLAFFNPMFFQKSEVDVFTVYKVNGTIHKDDRLRHKGAKLSTIENFKQKIKKAIPDSEVSIVYENKHFTISIDSLVSNILLICDYKLVILRAYIITEEGNRKIDIKKNDGIVKVVNNILRKQRYYYKRKAEKNEGSKDGKETDSSLSDIWS